MTGYQPRTYRDKLVASGLVGFEVKAGATDLLIFAESDLQSVAADAVLRYRRDIEHHIQKYPEFLSALEPLDAVPCPPIVGMMYAAATVAGVGPMAGVAGAMAECVGRELLRRSGQVIVENGGDIFLSSTEARRIALHAGRSPFSGRIALMTPGDAGAVAICTSSATVGHSLSFGRADAVTVVAEDGALADALATAGCNSVKRADDIEPTLEWLLSKKGVLHALIAIGDRLGTQGCLELCPIPSES